MASQFQLFNQRKFTSMFGTQFLGSFNDNLFKQALILVLTYSIAQKIGMGDKISMLTNLAAILFILPYFLFSSLAGQLADKYEKSALTRKIKILEIVIMILASIGFIFELYWSLFVALFLLGTQSTFFGPIKYAYLPQTMNKDELVGANGLFQTGTSLSILLGMIVAGILTQMNHAIYWICGTTIMVAILGYVFSSRIPHTSALQPDLTVNFNIATTSWQTIKYLYSLPLLFFIVLGNSWFWFCGATILTQTPVFSKEILQGNESVVILMLMLFSVGVSIGSLLCKTLTKNRISFALLPFGIAGLSLFTIDLYFSLQAFEQIDATKPLLGITDIFNVPQSFRVFTDLFFLGFSGGLYIVPLYAAMQAYSPKNHRARVVGGNNIFNAFFMVIAGIFAIITLGKFTPAWQGIPTLFLLTGCLNIGFGIFLFTQLKKYEHSMPLQTEDSETTQ